MTRTRNNSALRLQCQILSAPFPGGILFIDIDGDTSTYIDGVGEGPCGEGILADECTADQVCVVIPNDAGLIGFCDSGTTRFSPPNPLPASTWSNWQSRPAAQ